MPISVKPSPCGTHHTLGGKPMYQARFDWVLPFHKPGLAPVGRGGEAWHVDYRGQAAYPQRFRRTFGFYQEHAAVVDEHGWFHIRPDGTPVYDERYAWVGNYQDWRCTARTATGRYLHLNHDGVPAYPERYRYAGDYRKGVAVVQLEDGRSVHVDTKGQRLNDTAWLDLDVFHKGCARARDESGWTHVDQAGRPLYPQRYAMVEPFYNGQARVEERSGRRLVIDEQGAEVLVLRDGEAAEPVKRRSATPATRGQGVFLAGSDDIPAERGHLMAERYLADVGRPLCRNVVGAIYRAWDSREHRSVLIKSRRATSYAEREAQALELLATHPAAPALLDRFDHAGSACLVLEPRAGQPLGTRQYCAPMEPTKAAAVLRPILGALERLHRGGLVHGDLHPLNVLLDPDGDVTLLDYELAVPWSPAEPWRGEIFWGLWDFAPPEQLSPIGTLTPASDLFAAGALLYCLLVGQPPFRVRLDRLRSGGWEAVREDCLRQRREPLDLGPVPAACRPLLGRALDPVPVRRFSTAASMVEALTALGGQP